MSIWRHCNHDKQQGTPQIELIINSHLVPAIEMQINLFCSIVTSKHQLDQLIGLLDSNSSVMMCFSGNLPQFLIGNIFSHLKKHVGWRLWWNKHYRWIFNSIFNVQWSNCIFYIILVLFYWQTFCYNLDLLIRLWSKQAWKLIFNPWFWSATLLKTCWYPIMG